jgi:hypothetical protein
MTMAALKLYQLLKPKLGERETEALINFVDVKVKENKEEMQEFNLKTLASKEDLWKFKEELKGDIVGIRIGLKEDIYSLRTELKGDISSLRIELKEDIASLKNELKGDIGSVRTEFKGEISRLEVKISDFKSDIIRWVFAFFIALMLAIIGLYFKR